MKRDVTDYLLRRALYLPSHTSTWTWSAEPVVWIALFLLSWSVVFASIERSQLAPSFVHLILSRDGSEHV